MPLVFSVLELSSRYPDEGGIYVWSKRAFGLRIRDADAADAHWQTKAGPI